MKRGMKRGILVFIAVVGMALILVQIQQEKSKTNSFQIEREPVSSPSASVEVSKATPKPQKGIEKIAAVKSAPIHEAQSEFGKKLTQTLQTLPTLESLKSLSSEEVHQTPQILLEAGMRIGEIETELEQDASRGPEVIQFYDHCLQRGDLAVAVRALCYVNLKRHDAQHSRLNDPEIPKYVKNLADRIRSQP